MRNSRRGRSWSAEFGGSGEDSFVAVVVTKLTGALLFILLLTMVIMALIPRAQTAADPPMAPLRITTQALPDAVAHRSYTVTLATQGGSGQVAWSLEGKLPVGLTFDPATGLISGTPAHAVPAPTPLQVVAVDGSAAVRKSLALQVLSSDQASAPTPVVDSTSAAPWRDWLQRGFGYIVLVAVWISGLGVVASLEHWSRARAVVSPSRFGHWRFAGYRVVVSLAALAAGIALRYCTGI